MNTRFILMLLLAALLAGAAYGQFRSRSSRNYTPDNTQTAREVMQHTDETPLWTNAPGFQKDVFTFVRLRYSNDGHPTDSRGYYYGRSRWATDFPDADLNISWRLQQMTSLKVDPNARVLSILDPELFRYPFTYIVEPGGLMFADDEVPVLRRYLLHGGFLMFDDFWGEAAWENVAYEMKRVFPDREWVDLPRTHPVFSCVFPLPPDLNLQCPNVNTGTWSQQNGVTWETPDSREMHVRAILDDKGRIMCIATHNTDNGDGWEREGENEYYFREFAEKKAYPLGINIIFYAMTH
jgi:hypothetical protein